MKNDPLKSYQASRDALLHEKATLESRLQQINAALKGDRTTAPAGPRAKAAAAAPAPRRRRKRLKNDMTLKQACLKVVQDKALSRREIVAAVKKVGYKFAAKDPLNSLSALLYRDKAFKNDGGKFSAA